jgi:DNA polymerase III delta subunit
MAKSSATDQANVVLAVGKEAILIRRVIEGVMTSARKADPAAVRQNIIADEDTAAGELANALSPSLFGELTVIVVDGIDAATDEQLIATPSSNEEKSRELLITGA